MKRRKTGSGVSCPLVHQIRQAYYINLVRVTFLLFPWLSVKHHLSGIVGNVDISTYLDWVILWVNVNCASTDNTDYVSVNVRVSLGSMFKLLKILLFRAFQIYHKIQTNWWSSRCGITLQNKWSIFVKSDSIGKKSGFNGILESAQTCTVGGYLKTHGLLISQLLHILYSVYPFESLSLEHVSQPLYIMILIAKENVYLRWNISMIIIWY